MKERTKKYLTGAAGVLGAAFLVAAGVMALLGSKQVKYEATIEAGTKFKFDAAEYFDMKDYELDKLSADTSKLDITTAGEYDVFVTGGGRKYTIKVKVEDTTAPVIRDEGVYIFTNDMNAIDTTGLGAYYDVCECTAKVDTFVRVGDLKAFDKKTLKKYVDGLVTDKDKLENVPGLTGELSEGLYTARYTVTDASGNFDTVEVLVILDKTAPVVTEEPVDMVVKQSDVTQTPEMKVYTLTDNVDGVIRGRQCETSVVVKDEKNHTYTATQSCTDRAGNKVEFSYMITVEKGSAEKGTSDSYDDTDDQDTDQEGNTEKIDDKKNTESSSDDKTLESEKDYTYKKMNKTMYAKSSVAIRDLPSQGGEKVGSLAKGSAVKVTGQCKETGWYRFKFDGKNAYVSGDYLSEKNPSSGGDDSEDEEAGQDPIASLEDGEKCTVQESDGKATYFNWNGHIVRLMNDGTNDYAKCIKEACYADYYEIVIYGEYIGMKIKDFYNLDDELDSHSKLNDYVKELGYRKVHASTVRLDENTDGGFVFLEFEEKEE